MTVSSPNYRIQYGTNGTTGPWTVPFKFLQNAHLQVVYATAAGTETTLLLDTDYSVTGAGAETGTVTTTVAYAAGGTITIVRDLPLTQETDYGEGDPFPANTHEMRLDWLTMAIQQMSERLDRALSFPIADSLVSPTLPGDSARALKALTFDASGDPVCTQPADGTIGSFGADLLDDTQPTNGGGMVGHGAGVDYPDGSLSGHVSNYIYVDADYETASDGVTDDNTKINSAFTRSQTTGGTVVFNGLKTYGLGTQMAVPANAKVQTNGAVFRDLNGTAGTSPLITVAAGATIDRLSIDVPTGKTRRRAVSFTGGQVTGDVTVTYADQQTGSVNDDAAVRISSATKVRIGGLISVTKHDRGVQILNSSEVDIGGLALTSYVRGLLIENSTDVQIGRSKIVTASPNASYTAGHVGVLIQSATADSSRNITLTDFRIEDSGEHGIRLGGPERISNVHIVRPRVKNVGGSGIKILGTDSGTPTATNEQIFIDNPVIEDCGTGGLTNNMCGLLLMFCTNVTVSNPIIRKQSKLQSGYYGIRIAAVTSLQIDTPNVSDATLDGIFVDNSLGDTAKVTVNGGLLASNGRDGYRLTTGGLNAVRRIIVDGPSCDSNAAYGVNIAIGAATAVDSKIRIFSYNNTTDSIACDSTAFHIDVTGATTTPPTAANSSVIKDLTNTKIRGGGVWNTLALP
jgi:hypothetical protein